MKQVLIFVAAVFISLGNALSVTLDSLKNETVQPSSFYTASVNGKQLFVYDSPVASFIILDVNGKSDFTIRASRDVKWVDIRPKNMSVQAEWKDSIIHFSLDKPCNLSLELNADPLFHPLFIFAGEKEENLPDKSNSKLIYFGPGKIYKPGIISPKSGQEIWIDQGAIVQGVIELNNVENVRIHGRGILLGERDRGKDNWKHNRITVRDSRNIKISGICIVDSHSWTIVPVNSENVTIDNVKIFSDNGSDDGIDICRSRHVSISNSFIRTKDDCIAIKGNFNYPDSVITSDIQINGSVFWNAAWGNGIDIGFELQCAEVKNIVVGNCDFIHVDKGATIAIHNGDKAKVSNIKFEDIRIEDSNQKLFDLAIFYNRYAVDKPRLQRVADSIYLQGAWDGVLYLDKKQKIEHASFRGYIQDIVFRNISVTDGVFPYSLFCGYDNLHLVKNVSIENLVVHGKRIATLKDARIYTEFAEGIQIK